MTRLAAILSAAALLTLPAAAGAKTTSTFTIRGAGFGHGVGMSQYGALGYAQHGWTAPAILAHYYTGTQLGTTDPSQTVRVLLATPSSARVTGAAQAGARKLDAATTYTVRRAGVGELSLKAGSRKIGTFTAPLEIAGTGGIVQYAGHGTYRGTLEITPGLASGVNVVNAVALDDYVQGVVPAESPASWPLEALKAQAIAARTYAITTKRGGAFDQYADTRSQVYGGVAVETPASNAAVAQTRGQVVTYQGRPAVTYFFSTSGGRTENIENSFTGAAPEPWLKSVRDPYDSVSPRHRWTVRMSVSRAARKLRGLYTGRFKGVRVLERGVSPRVVSAQVLGSRGSLTVDGNTLKAQLGLYDTWAYFRTVTSRKARGRASALPNPQSVDATRATAAARAHGRQILSGTVVPGARGTRIVLQEQVGGRWRAARTSRLGAGGGYAIDVPHAGLFRVVCAGGVGPAVRF
jgi:SpoIID/LytB domain protein